MLTVPFLIGGAAADSIISGTWLAGLTGVLLLYISRPPLALLMKRKMIDGGFGPDAAGLWLNFLVPAALGTGVFVWLMIAEGLTQLLWAGACGLSLFMVHGYLVLKRRERSQMAELVGVAMLTLTAPLAVCLGTGEFIARLPLALWFLCALYFGGSVFYVKLRLRSTGRAGRQLSRSEKLHRARGLIAYLLVTSVSLIAIGVAGLIPALAIAAFLPVIIWDAVRVFAIDNSLRIRTEGFIQMGLSLAFLVIMVAAF